MPAEIIDRTETGFTLQITVLYNKLNAWLRGSPSERTQRGRGSCYTRSAQAVRLRWDTDRRGRGDTYEQGATTQGVPNPLWNRHRGTARLPDSKGGATYCPLDRDARIIVSSTPRFAKMVSSKYTEFGSSRVQNDLGQNHGRVVSRCLVQDIADAVSAAALVKEEDWSYSLPRLPSLPTTVAVSLDGTCALMCEDGWRETMVGTISVYDKQGERQHTIYVAATPEYGKAKFLGRLESEVIRIKAGCPDARYVGIADGAKGNWQFLEKHTDVQVVDFWHASEYLGKAATVLYRKDPKSREAWMEEQCHTLKHESGGAALVLKKLKSQAKARPWAKADPDVRSAITYFENQNAAGRMDYAARVSAMDPIGSGVTEAACKVIVKQRLCGSGMKWKEAGAAAVLSLRCLSYTTDRWAQFWSKIDRWGYPVP